VELGGISPATNPVPTVTRPQGSRWGYIVICVVAVPGIGRLRRVNLISLRWIPSSKSPTVFRRPFTYVTCVYIRNVREITVRDGTSVLIEKDLRRSAEVAPVRQSA